MIEVRKKNLLFNEEVNKCLDRIINNKSFANGYIFYGAEGLGKKQTALKFIKEILQQLVKLRLLKLLKYDISKHFLVKNQ